MYRTDAAWGGEDDLLSGYESKFLSNLSPMPSYLKWPVGLVNVEIWNEIRDHRPDIVVLMSWMNLTWWIAVSACVYFRIPFLYMTDANVQAEVVGPNWKRWVKQIMLGKFLFKRASGFLCAGASNSLLYQYYGVPQTKLVPFAYSWGYESLLEASREMRGQGKLLRAELGILQNSFVVLYCGRLSQEKNPLDLIKAYQQLKTAGASLVFVGDGPMAPQLHQYVKHNGLDSVYFCGFHPRDQIPKFYAMADVLVLPSRRETWGIVVNEALCFGLPVIVSDQVGAARDLVVDGGNGFEFPEGDVQALTERVERLMTLPAKQHSEMRAFSLDLITKWCHRDLAETLNEYFDSLYSGKAAITS